MGKATSNLLKVQAFAVFVFTSFLSSCVSDPEKKAANVEVDTSKIENKYYDGKGIGPITEIVLDSIIDNSKVSAGEAIFAGKCISCHKVSNEKLVGPGLAGITKLRRPEWIMNMMLNPMEMTQKDSLAKELLSIYYSQMLDNNLKQEEARSVLEYLRTK
jgi:mono/diheme cytochrome c family protein